MGYYDFIALDVETANRSRSSLCAIGLAAVKDGQIVRSGSWLVNPLVEFDPYNTRNHGLDAAAVAGAPTLAELWEDVGITLHGESLVAHNAMFDLGVLRSSAANAGLDGGPEFDMWCTWRIAKRVWPDMSSHGLDYLARSFDIPCEHHDPQSDARACAEVALRLCREYGTSRLDEMIDALDPQGGEHHLGFVSPRGIRPSQPQHQARCCRRRFNRRSQPSPVRQDPVLHGGIDLDGTSDRECWGRRCRGQLQERRLEEDRLPRARRR